MKDFKRAEWAERRKGTCVCSKMSFAEKARNAIITLATFYIGFECWRKYGITSLSLPLLIVAIRLSDFVKAQKEQTIALVEQTKAIRDLIGILGKRKTD